MDYTRFKGTWTALISPFKSNGGFDWGIFNQLVDFQKDAGVNVLFCGTTSESPTLSWEEHTRVIEQGAIRLKKSNILVMAGTGSNNTHEAVNATRHALEAGADVILGVDCYYNKPASVHLRKFYHEPLADAVSESFNTGYVPYIIPGRTGGEGLSVDDLAILAGKYANVVGVKEATGNLERMNNTRKLLGNGFNIFSGDDSLNYQILSDPNIKGSGVISVVSNIVPYAVKELVDACFEGRFEDAKKIENYLKPLNEIVGIKVLEQYPDGSVKKQNYPNPIPIKTLLYGIGMPSMHFKAPLGPMGLSGVMHVRDKLKEAYELRRDIFKPLEDRFGLNAGDALAEANRHKWEEMAIGMD